LKKPTGSIQFLFYKPETEKNRVKPEKKTESNKKPAKPEKTEPKPEKNRVKSKKQTKPNQKKQSQIKKTKSNQFEPVFVLKTEPKPISLNRFWFSFGVIFFKIDLVIFFIKTESN